jgi:hypothetical protein
MFEMAMGVTSSARWRTCSTVLVAPVSATDTTGTGFVKSSRKKRASKIVAFILQKDFEISGWSARSQNHSSRLSAGPSLSLAHPDLTW